MSSRALSTVLVCAAAAVAAVCVADRFGPAPAAESAADGPAAATPPAAPDRAEIAAAVARGLVWLAREQERCGGWVGHVGNKQMDSYVVHFGAERAREQGRGHPGVTGFAGLAFLASGHVPGTAPYGPVVERAVDYLLAGDPSDEYITDCETNMYGHAFATIFLAQVEGMARGRDPRVMARLRAAAHLIERSQNAVGGWRYYPHAEECDLSVTVCQAQALRTAKEAGVDVKASTVKRVIGYLERSRIPSGSERGCFYYKITGRSARTRTSFAVNAAAVATLHAAGVYDEKQYGPALRFLEREYDDVQRYYADHFYFWYGNWHAVQAFRMEGGARFAAYYARVAKDLLAMQREDGRWVNTAGPGDAWATAVACLILTVPDGLLPLFAN